MVKDIKPQHTQKLRMGHQICSIGKEVRGRKDSRDRRVDACQGRDHRNARLTMTRLYSSIDILNTICESLVKATREALLLSKLMDLIQLLE